ncbi:hypothetical protein B0H19DRAFT_1084459 [Mycena capillaripes]|nr:hypothetical protein B0H19DRAFT_1084459 [Mycena capillaripes]
MLSALTCWVSERAVRREPGTGGPPIRNLARQLAINDSGTAFLDLLPTTISVASLGSAARWRSATTATEAREGGPMCRSDLESKPSATRGNCGACGMSAGMLGESREVKERERAHELSAVRPGGSRVWEGGTFDGDGLRACRNVGVLKLRLADFEGAANRYDFEDDIDAMHQGETRFDSRLAGGQDLGESGESVCYRIHAPKRACLIPTMVETLVATHKKRPLLLKAISKADLPDTDRQYNAQIENEDSSCKRFKPSMSTEKLTPAQPPQEDGDAPVPDVVAATSKSKRRTQKTNATTKKVPIESGDRSTHARDADPALPPVAANPVPELAQNRNPEERAEPCPPHPPSPTPVTQDGGEECADEVIDVDTYNFKDRKTMVYVEIDQTLTREAKQEAIENADLHLADHPADNNHAVNHDIEDIIVDQAEHASDNDFDYAISPPPQFGHRHSVAPSSRKQSPESRCQRPHFVDIPSPHVLHLPPPRAIPPPPTSDAQPAPAPPAPPATPLAVRLVDPTQPTRSHSADAVSGSAGPSRHEHRCHSVDRGSRSRSASSERDKQEADASAPRGHPQTRTSSLPPSSPVRSDSREENGDDWEAGEKLKEKQKAREKAYGKRFSPTVKEEDEDDEQGYEEEVEQDGFVGEEDATKKGKAKAKGPKPKPKSQSKGKAREVPEVDNNNNNSDSEGGSRKKSGPLPTAAGAQPAALSRWVEICPRGTCGSDITQRPSRKGMDGVTWAKECTAALVAAVKAAAPTEVFTEDMVGDSALIWERLPSLLEWHEQLEAAAVACWQDEGKLKEKIRKEMKPILQIIRAERIRNSTGVVIWGWSVDKGRDATFSLGVSEVFKEYRKSKKVALEVEANQQEHVFTAASDTLARMIEANLEGTVVPMLPATDVVICEKEKTRDMYRRVFATIMGAQLWTLSGADLQKKNFRMVWNPRFLDIALQNKCRIINDPGALCDVKQIIGSDFKIKGIKSEMFAKFVPALTRANAASDPAEEPADDEDEDDPPMSIVPWDVDELAWPLEEQGGIALVMNVAGAPLRCVRHSAAWAKQVTSAQKKAKKAAEKAAEKAEKKKRQPASPSLSPSRSRSHSPPPRHCQPHDSYRAPFPLPLHCQPLNSYNRPPPSPPAHLYADSDSYNHADYRQHRRTEESHRDDKCKSNATCPKSNATRVINRPRPSPPARLYADLSRGKSSRLADHDDRDSRPPARAYAKSANEQVNPRAQTAGPPRLDLTQVPERSTARSYAKSSHQGAARGSNAPSDLARMSAIDARMEAPRNDNRGTRGQLGEKEAPPTQNYRLTMWLNDQQGRIFYAVGFDETDRPTRADKHTYVENPLSGKWERIPVGYTPICRTEDDHERYIKNVRELTLFEYQKDGPVNTELTKGFG